MQIPIDAAQSETAAQRRHDAERLGRIGENLLRRGQIVEAATAFEQAESLAPSDFQHFPGLAYCYLQLKRPEAALRVCDRGSEVMPNGSDLLLGIAFTAAEALLLPLARDLDGSRLLAACEELPSTYANCTVVRAFRAIALSRVGRTEDARKLIDLDRYVAQIAFTPPAEFGGIERFNELLAEEILCNPGLRYTDVYGFHRTEHLDIKGARAFPALAKFLKAAIAEFIAQFPRRGLDLILPPAPTDGFLRSAGNVVRDAEHHHSHIHKFAYVSGVYHVCVPQDAGGADDRAGALVLGTCDDFTGRYVPCWGHKDINPVPGVATIFPSHIFHSVVPTRSRKPRIAVPFDLGIVIGRPTFSPHPVGYRWLSQRSNYSLTVRA